MLTQPAPPDVSIVDPIHDFVKEGIDLQSGRLETESDPFWKGLCDLGSELWLDTGDIEGATALWTDEFTALTTNNTLLNAEVQKGIYDDLIQKAAKVLSGLDIQMQVIEIAFILNARHGLRLVQRFGGRVSVELHTDLAHDIERSVFYGRRFYDICPEHFIIKVPLTPSGLIAMRRLREEGIPVNFTLGFSARHNYIATAFGAPSYVNVFLGRLNAYIADHQLGDGKLVGEKAALASQRAVKSLAQGSQEPTRQIAASLRGAGQVADLAGINVLTMPVNVVAAAKQELSGAWEYSVENDYTIHLNDGVSESDLRLHTLWEVSDSERRLADSLRTDVPQAAEEVVERAHDFGAGDVLPRVSDADLAQIAADGKIPKHEVWADRIKSGEVAIDTLLNLAGLDSFATDQQALDDRIRRLIKM
jgi:transaldolase